MFFDRLSEACAARNTSPSAIAVKIGRSKSNVTGWKNGQIPASDTVTDIAGALKLPIDFFLERPPFDCWELINQNRAGFLHYVDIDPIEIDLMWGVDPEAPDAAALECFVSFLSDAITSVRPTSEGDWVVKVRPAYQRKKETPTLTKKDERDIARDLETIMAKLEDGGCMMFDGDPMTDEARESIMAAMKLGLQAAKAKNKARFTPEKHRKG